MHISCDLEIADYVKKVAKALGTAADYLYVCDRRGACDVWTAEKDGFAASITCARSDAASTSPIAKQLTDLLARRDISREKMNLVDCSNQ